ncbi:MAG TPA: ABC transporter substrate-binding protein [Candidatus Tectomicrobia bacterium]
MWCSAIGCIVTITLSLLAVPLAAGAQPAGKVWRIGVLMGLPRETPRYAPFHQGLREFGYVEGQNLVIEWRYAEGHAERFPDLAAELTRLDVDVIVAGDNPAIAAAQRATSTIPIVMVLAMDPVRTGFVDSLARPGGNITGLTAQATDIQGKALQLLKDAVPTASRVAILWDATEPGRRVQATEAADAARALGLEVQLVEVRSPAELDSLFTTMVRERVDAVLVHSSQIIGTHRARLAALAAQSRLPTMGVAPWWGEAGGLMAYSARDLDRFQRAASYVDKLLRGTKAADLPVEQPMKFKFVINLQTAKTLGLTIPPTLLFQADEVIQ